MGEVKANIRLELLLLMLPQRPSSRNVRHWKRELYSRAPFVLGERRCGRGKGRVAAEVEAAAGAQW
jgi:hypothetical protein